VKRTSKLVLAVVLLMLALSCGSRKSRLLLEMQSAPKGLFDRGTELFRAQRFQEAITLFETLSNAYPDSKYVESARLVLINCDRIEACASVRAQARTYPGGVQTFFPNMPEEKARQRNKPSAHH
jgi:outer membrane protein assembly factor BamD (BamD/ComL family)